MVPVLESGTVLVLAMVKGMECRTSPAFWIVDWKKTPQGWPEVSSWNTKPSYLLVGYEDRLVLPTGMMPWKEPHTVG